jgi:hypothetical protein
VAIAVCRVVDAVDLPMLQLSGPLQYLGYSPMLLLSCEHNTAVFSASSVAAGVVALLLLNAAVVVIIALRRMMLLPCQCCGCCDYC